MHTDHSFRVQTKRHCKLNNSFQKLLTRWSIERPHTKSCTFREGSIFSWPVESIKLSPCLLWFPRVQALIKTHTHTHKDTPFHPSVLLSNVCLDGYPEEDMPLVCLCVFVFKSGKGFCSHGEPRLPRVERGTAFAKRLRDSRPQRMLPLELSISFFPKRKEFLFPSA